MKIRDIREGFTVLPPIDKEKYQARDGLEGPFRLKNNKVVYYDPREGKYYDPDTDMYIEYDDYRKMDEADDKRPGYVVKASDKPKTVKPNTGGSSKHPYQGKLVGESQWGEPKDVLSQVLQTLEKEVEWPLTDVMDPQQVKQLLSPLMQAVSQKLNSLNEAEVGNTDYQFAHGKKPSGHGSWFFVAHRGGIDFGKDVEDHDYIQLHGMTYGEAKKAAIKWAKSKGHSQLFVAT